jgi:hypothetical protein
MMTQDVIRKHLAEIDRRFAVLDRRRLAALEDGDLAACEKIAEEQDRLFERGEELRSKLGTRLP